MGPPPPPPRAKECGGTGNARAAALAAFTPRPGLEVRLLLHDGGLLVRGGGEGWERGWVVSSADSFTAHGAQLASRSSGCPRQGAAGARPSQAARVLVLATAGVAKPLAPSLLSSHQVTQQVVGHGVGLRRLRAEGEGGIH